jgi:hypothetical protein
LVAARTKPPVIRAAARTTWRPWRTHLVQLFHLVGRQDFRQFGLHIGFQVRQLFLLVGGEVQAFPGLRGQQVIAGARPGSGRRSGRRTAFVGGRTLTVTRRRAVLGVDEIRCGAERQGQED